MDIPVDIIIPHYKGSEKFHRCLESLFKTDYADFRVIVVDNGCIDDSVERSKELFPQISVLKLEENRGFAGGCNAGVNFSDREYVTLLNDDTEVEPDWLSKLMLKISSDKTVAAVQPKLRWIIDKRRFDYAGGMGGMMDIFGYPFCYGRLFETIEEDKGQYDWVEEIFWASGSASLFRRDLYLEAGGLDERFFAHMEEIDLNWRLQLMGYKIKAAPQSVVYHYAGATLAAGDFRKKYFNHRNSLLMILKNFEWRNLLWILPLRILLELAATVLAVKQKDYRRIIAIFRGGWWNIWNIPCIFAERSWIRRHRTVSDREMFRRMYWGTAALQYYLYRKRTYFQLYADGKMCDGSIKYRAPSIK